jgi:hypothetical protein
VPLYRFCLRLACALPVTLLCGGAPACSTRSGASDLPQDAGGQSFDTGPAVPPEGHRCISRDASVPDGRSGDAGAAALASLAVSGRTVVPAFSPDITDYYVECAAGPNDIHASAEGAAGASVSFSVETPAAPEGALRSVAASGPPAKTSLTLTGGQALVATATAPGKPKQEYWVRCLPPGFPRGMQWAAHDNGCHRVPGYYLVSTINVPKGDLPLAIVFDTNGVPVWYAQNPKDPDSVYNLESLTPNTLSFWSERWQVNTLGGRTVFPRAAPYDGGVPVEPDVHELRVLPNGHYLAIASPAVPMDLSGVSLPLADGGVETIHGSVVALACQVQEFDAAGHVYWEWTATEHFDPVKAWVFKARGGLLDYEPFHCNSIDVDTSSGDPNQGNLLVSARHMSSVFEIDKKTGKVLWMMGGAADSSLDHATYVDVADGFVAQHDGRFQASWKGTCSGGNGEISLFDDQTQTGKPARGVIYRVNVNDGSGCAGGTTGPSKATVAWEYTTWKNAGSQASGSLRVSAGGSHLIGWGQSEPVPDGLIFTEVDEQGHDLLDLLSTDATASYRAVKVPLTQLDLELLRRTSGS